MAQRRISRKSFRKSKGRKTRSMRKRTIGGAAGDEELETDVNKLIDTLKGETYKTGRQQLDFIDLIKTLTNRGRTRCKSFMVEDAKCEKKKAEYYFAAAFALLSQIKQLKEKFSEFDTKDEVQTLFDKAEEHSREANKKEINKKLKAEGKKRDVEAGHAMANVPQEYLVEYNTVTADPNLNFYLVVDALLKKLPAPSPAPSPATETTTASAAPPSEGGRKSRRKRKSRRR